MLVAPSQGNSLNNSRQTAKVLRFDKSIIPNQTNQDQSSMTFSQELADEVSWIDFPVRNIVGDTMRSRGDAILDEQPNSSSIISSLEIPIIRCLIKCIN